MRRAPQPKRPAAPPGSVPVPPGSVPSPRPPRRWWRRETVALVELWALCGLAIAQPVLDVTGRAPDFFLFHHADRADILLMVTIVVAAPPLLLWAAGAAVHPIGRRARRGVHVLTIGILVAALAIQAGRWLSPLRGAPLALLAASAGALTATGYLRWRPARQLVRLAGVGPPLFALLFAFASPTSALLAGDAAGSGRTGIPFGPHPPIVLIILDELPQASLLDDAGRLDRTRFPNFARLAADSTWYRNATAVRGFTPYAVPSMLTGRFPTRRVAPHYSQYPDNLFTLLSGVYRVRAQENVVNLCPPRVCHHRAGGPDTVGGPDTGGDSDTGGGTDTGGGGGSRLPSLLGAGATVFQRLVSVRDDTGDPAAGLREPTVAERDGAARRQPADPATFRWAFRRDSQPVRFRDFVAGLRPAPQPTLHFLHLLLPHRPFRYLPSGTQYAEPERLPRSGPWWARLARERHLLQVGYVDRLLGTALRALHTSGLYDDALIVVTADHGIGFTARRGYQRNIFADQEAAAAIAWVPLFIKEPGQRTGRVSHRDWLQTDLMPTIADYAGLRVPWPVDGISAVRRTRTGAGKPFTWAAGRALTLDTERHRAAVLAGADAANPLPGGPPPDLVGALVGTPVGRYPVRSSTIRATMPGRLAFDRVDPASGTVPALFTGTVQGVVPAGRLLALALNGTIAAVVPVLPEAPGTPRFGGLVSDESLFRTGRNHVELFLVDGSGTGRRDGNAGGRAAGVVLDRLRR